MYSGAKLKSSRQDGIVVLVLVVFIALTTIAYFLNEFSPEKIQHQQAISTSKSLSRAKDALIAHAVSRADINSPSAQPGRLGYLPCPANNNGEGNSVGNCGSRNEAALGWFPWRSLGLPPLRDESGACLLYAVSGSYKFRPPADMLNEDTYGMFQVVDESFNIVQGANPEDRVVAIVFAAGKALPGQSRTYNAGSQCGDDIDNFGAYLDRYVDASGTIDNSRVTSGSVDQIDRFIHATAESMSDDAARPHNDRFITITRDDIWPALMGRAEFDAADTTGNSKIRRVTEVLARCLAQYGNDNGNSRLPYPAPFNLNGNDYREGDDYDDAPAVAGGQHFGRFPYIVDSADAEIPGTIAESRLFEKNFSAPPVHAEPNDIRQCDDLHVRFLTDPPGPPFPPNADLRTATSEDRIFWENRKDHFFYAVSNSYRPSSFPPDDTAGAPRCGNCISIDGVQYAAVVIYAGEKEPPFMQTRKAPIAPTDTEDTKMNFINYVEIPGATGNGMGSYKTTGNDVMFCLTDTEPLTVVPCPP
jgi:hypothetical protein